MGWNITDSKELEDVIFKLKLKLVQKVGVRRGMSVIEVGCGQGGFTVSLAKIVREQGKILSVDISDEYLEEFMENLDKWGVKNIVTFIQADVANLEGVISDEVADMVVGYRFLEELKHPEDIVKIVEEMARTVKKGGKVCLIELSTGTRNEAEESYVRLHRESGDSLFEPHEIVEAMKEAKLTDIRMETFETNIWFSPDLAKQDLGSAQVWFTSDVEQKLGPLIDKYGMKYPALLIFSGIKN
ncbi:MAG: class I SAM-dependent methyltransferase [Candidatus Bathyarchaeota archaeon]|nr:class I SAM-dependent methyltransferase [Candidatus Bathyarchaeota archaeon]